MYACRCSAPFSGSRCLCALADFLWHCYICHCIYPHTLRSIYGFGELHTCPDGSGHTDHYFKPVVFLFLIRNDYFFVRKCEDGAYSGHIGSHDFWAGKLLRSELSFFPYCPMGFPFHRDSYVCGRQLFFYTDMESCFRSDEFFMDDLDRL